MPHTRNCSKRIQMKNFVKQTIERLKDNPVVRFIQKYPLGIICGAVLLFNLFFGDYNLMTLIKTSMRISKLEVEDANLINKIHEDSVKLHNLKTDNVNLARFAREQYGMKANDEDIFIIRYK